MFTTASITGIIAQLLPIILAGLADAAMKFMAQNRAHASDVALGSAHATQSVNQGTIDAQRRSSDAQINAPDLDVLLDQLGTGTVRF